jgi:hypothetical protein
MPIRLGLVNDNSIQQTFATNGRDERRIQIPQSVAENPSELFSTLDHLFLADELERADRDSAAERVTTVSRAMRAGFNGEHDVLATEHTRDRIHTS